MPNFNILDSLCSAEKYIVEWPEDTFYGVATHLLKITLKALPLAIQGKIKQILPPYSFSYTK